MAEAPLAKPEELRKMVEFSALINSSLDIQTVLNHAMDYVEYLLDAEASSIFQIDREKGDLFFRLARGEKAQAIKEMRLKMGEGIAGTVALTEEALLIDEASKDPRFCQRFNGQSGYFTRSILCVPLKSRERLVGVLEVLNKKDSRGFGQQDMDLLVLVGNLIGTAMENARLYGRLQDRLSATMEELRIAQEKLLRSQRLAALGKMAQGVAHEVRNPVAIIGGFVHRLKKIFAPDDPYHTNLEIIASELHKLERMVREIEAFTKLGEPSLRPTSLPELIEQALAQQAVDFQQQGIQVHMDIPAPFPLVPGDPHLLFLALGHLLVNAREAMPHGGLLTLVLRAEPNRVQLTIKDTGMGIAPADLPQVFDPFFSSKPQGTGMGLTVVYHIITNHLGEVELESVPGQGAAVHVWLPKY